MSDEEEYAAALAEETDLPYPDPEQAAPDQELIKQINGTLILLQQQLDEQAQITALIAKEIKNISLVIEKLETITADMPKVVYEQCLDSYKKIVQNAVKNYQEFQKSAAAWQKKVESKNQSSDFLVYSEILTPILLVILILLNLSRSG